MLILSILQRNAYNQFISPIANAKEHLGDEPLTDEIAKQVGEPKYADELTKLDKATDTTPPAEEKSFGDKARAVAGEVAVGAIKGVLGISEAHAADMPIMHRQPENQQDSDMVKTGYQSENNHRHSEQQNQAEKDRSGNPKDTQAEKQNIAIDDKLNPQTSAWAFKDPEKLNEFQEQGLVDKPSVGQDDKEEKKSDWDYRVGDISEKYETSGRGYASVGKISSGKNDKGGISYGTFQLKSKGGDGGRVMEYIRQSEEFGSEFDGLKVNSPEFKAKWKEIAEKDPDGFRKDQYNYIKSTHYDIQEAKLNKKGFDISNRSRAVKEEVWSISVQYGP